MSLPALAAAPEAASLTGPLIGAGSALGGGLLSGVLNMFSSSRIVNFKGR